MKRTKRKRQTIKWAQHCVNSVAPEGNRQHSGSLPNYRPDSQDVADITALRAYGRSICYPNLEERPTWLDEFMTAFRPYLCSLTSTWLSSEYRQDVEDIVQSTLVRVLKHATALRETESDVRAFVMNALKWEILNYYVISNRGRSRTALTVLMTCQSFDDGLEGYEIIRPEIELAGSTPHPEEAYIARMLVRDALATLTPLQSQVLDAHLLRGYTLPEIAIMRDRCLAAIKDLMARGRRNLTAALTK